MKRRYLAFGVLLAALTAGGLAWAEEEGAEAPAAAPAREKPEQENPPEAERPPEKEQEREKPVEREKPAAREAKDKAGAEAAPTETPESSEIPPEFDLPQDPKSYVTALRGLIAKQKEKMLAKIEAKHEASQEKKMGALSAGIGWFSLAGFFLLFTPLFLHKKYPGKFGLLFKYSLLACVSFIVSVNLFASVMLLMKSAQGIAGSATNPQYSIAEATFDVLSEQAEELAVIGPTLLEAPLARVASGEEENVVSAILNNVQTLKADVMVFKRIGDWFKGLSGLFGYVPTILTVLAVLAFVMTMKPMIAKIVGLPAQAAAGNVSGASVVKEVFFTLLKEVLVTLLVIVVLIFSTLVAGVLLATLAKPAVEALLGYAITAILYVLLAKDFSTTWVYVSLVGSIAFLVLNVAIVLVSSGMFVGKAQKLLRLKMHEKVPLRSQWKFWVLGPLALIWVQVVPLIFISVAQPAVEHLIEWIMKRSGDISQVSWPTLLGSGPLVLVVGFLLFWLAWGLEPLLFIARFPAKKATA